MANKNPRVAPFWSPVPGTLALLLLLLGAATLLLGAVRADAATTLQVAPAGNDSGDCVASACATIGYAVGQAATDDTIEVATGHYDEGFEITVPGLTLRGAPGGGTVIGPAGAGVVARTAITLADGVDGVTLSDLSVVSRAQYQPAILASGDEAIDDVTLEGVAVTGIGPSTAPTTVASGLEISAPASGWTIAGSSFGDNYHGVLVSADVADLTIEGSTFAGNRNGLYVARSLPLGPDSTGTIDGLALSDSRFEGNEYRGLYFEGLSEATIEDVVVSGTGEGMASLPSGARALALNLKAGDFGDVSVSGSTFSGSVNEGVALQVRGYPGDTTYESAPATLDSFRLTGSTVIGNGGPGVAVDNQENTGSVEVSGSRIVGNGTQAPGAVTPVTGVFAWNEADGAPTVDAAENWFACNGDPAATGCAAVNANVEAPTWLVLGAGVAFPVLGPGEQTTVVAAVESSAGGDPLLPLPDGAEAHFSSSLGSFEPASEALLAGVTSSTFTAGAATGSGLVTVSVDGVEASAPITVQPPDAVPEPPPPTPDPAPLPEPPPPQSAPEQPAIKALANKGPAVVPSGGVLAVATVSCAAESCAVRPQGTPSVKVAGRSFRVQVKVPKTLGAGGSAKVRVVLPKKAREALAEEGKGRLRLKLRVAGSDGSTRTMTLTVVLKSKGNGGKRG